MRAKRMSEALLSVFTPSDICLQHSSSRRCHGLAVALLHERFSCTRSIVQQAWHGLLLCSQHVHFSLTDSQTVSTECRAGRTPAWQSRAAATLPARPGKRPRPSPRGRQTTRSSRPWPTALPGERLLSRPRARCAASAVHPGAAEQLETPWNRLCKHRSGRTAA